ncbi:glycosyl hydrolases family 18 domain-containing protein [Hirsutella rhossiliensis]|uniref:chitinase n=1 Tax=Hirsutella rhossiliensis TaxID=111463 RepID=A0A9P8NAQ8_9HYPO|nr:glycosyl hydrolases family 18 domain-containing protein [Hirsutella rhossiliensis]KAH0967707.1 glycosyl hydrolases family 18 domain-containing protein [Hirsutella rhossiliensis]
MRRLTTVSFVWAASLHFVRAAINIDGSQAVDPVTEHDPSPISDPTIYIPDQHDCPLACVDYSNMHSWTPFLSVDRLNRCREPMLLQFSVTQPLGDPDSTIYIRSCTLGGSFDFAPACASMGTQVDGKLDVATSGPGGEDDGGAAADLLQDMTKFFADKDNCNEQFLFAYHNHLVAGVYIGAGLGKPTASSALEALAATLRRDRPGSPGANHTVAKLCGGKRSPEQVFGISLNTTGDLGAVQRTALKWSLGEGAASNGQLKPSRPLFGVQVMEIAGANMTASRNSSSSASLRAASLGKRAVCRHIKVAPGDGCAALASRCGISGDDFSKYNPGKGFCATLQPEDSVCCSPGERYTPPKPQANADGSCSSHLIANGDSCPKLAMQHGVSVADIEKWNKGNTWAWTECSHMLVGYSMCLSPGLPPMPPQQGTECGPLVLGTKPPKETVSLAHLNPYPLKACCSNWGFCGVFPAQCDNTCVSNCGNEIKQNSGPPKKFQRIGYYESFGLERECLLLQAKHANTDGSNTHIHWAFASIDPATFKPVVSPKDQWEEFKTLSNVKRILSFGGWAYSTEPATYQILRSAIIDNRNVFASTLAQFAADEGLDGIDIDWEYPGAPDIYAGSEPIGRKGDGIAYLKFLTVLEKKLGSGKSVSIAAPASFWYLKAFPIDRIAAVIDYIVFMTYDLRGQWDYGNVNAFDSCPPGKYIRSHVTKAGVPNNKVFVGESSYGRSFRMAQDGCWGPCATYRGYISNAEINEIIKKSQGRTLNDGDSNTDVLLYQGDYISYMTPKTKDTRREDWKALNFAGSIDWAVDLQEFASDDFSPPKRNESGEGCVWGKDLGLDSGHLCEFSCGYGFCPESRCVCTETGTPPDLPSADSTVEAAALDSFDVDLNRLCKFACKYGWANSRACYRYQDYTKNKDELQKCKQICQSVLDEAEGDRTRNYGCVARFDIDKPIPWEIAPWGKDLVVRGDCNCNNWLVNEFANVVLDAMPIIAQIGCYILMSAVHLVLDVGASFIPGVGKTLDAGLDMAATAAQMASYIYPNEEDPEGAFSWWLSPCGSTTLVPDDIKKLQEAQEHQEGSGQKGDDGNPRSPKTRRPNTGGSGQPPPSKIAKKNPKCKIKKGVEVTKRVNGHTLQLLHCPNDQAKTVTEELIVTTVTYKKNAALMLVTKTCQGKWGQACYHYSSAIRENLAWTELPCPQEAATVSWRVDAKATAVWEKTRLGPGWKKAAEADRKTQHCDKDEWPPVGLLGLDHPARVKAGVDGEGQRVRLLPAGENRGAGSMWRGICLNRALDSLTDKDFRKEGKSRVRPNFAISAWEHAGTAKDDGLWDNGCWPKGITSNDPGYTLLTLDNWYKKNPRGPNGRVTQWDYTAKFELGRNGG